MQIYVGHSTAFDYQKDLYQPLKASLLWKQHQFILPHDKQSLPINSKAIISKVDFVMAEVSYPSTGLGIELGWADDASCNILCLHQQNIQPSSSLSIITSQFISYTDPTDLINQLADWFKVRIYP